jgi:hypothetical protein
MMLQCDLCCRIVDCDVHPKYQAFAICPSSHRTFDNVLTDAGESKKKKEWNDVRKSNITSFVEVRLFRQGKIFASKTRGQSNVVVEEHHHPPKTSKQQPTNRFLLSFHRTSFLSSQKTKDTTCFFAVIVCSSIAIGKNTKYRSVNDHLRQQEQEQKQQVTSIVPIKLAVLKDKEA